ncbi:MAG: serine/threonine protein kinase [Polyangiaceae bacterium]|nr:serine/threonine protein kinase [Polyangiaceae bacterium]
MGEHASDLQRAEGLTATLAGTPYVPVRRLAATQLSEVHVVRHRALGHEAVMKVLAAVDGALVEDLERRLLREGRVLVGLDHENIVKVLDFGFTLCGRPYLVVELLDGKTLKQEVREGGTLPVAEVLDIAAQTLSALTCAHEAGLVHRDLKPDNIMRLRADGAGPRRIKVLDFGIVKIVDEKVRERVGGVVPTTQGQIVGTPAFASPEQIMQGAIDARTDLYAVGGVIFYLLTGRAPFLGVDLADLLNAHLTSSPIPPSRMRSDVPPALDALVLKALSKSPADRYPSAAAMLEALRAVSPADEASTKATVRLEEKDTQPLPPETLRMLASESAGTSADDTPRLAAPEPATKASDVPAAQHDDSGTSYASMGSLLVKAAEAALASSEKLRPVNVVARRTVPMTTTQHLEASSKARARSASRPPPSSRARPRSNTTIYAVKIIALSLLLALAAIGLLHVLGIDR